MFDGFQDPRDQQGRRRFAASTAASLVALAAAGALLVALADPRERARRRPPVEVVFRAPPPAAEPPPPPPAPEPAAPEPEPEPRPRRAAAPTGAAAAPAVPTAIPAGQLAEADPDLFRSLGSVAELGQTPLFAGASAAPPPPPPPPSPAARRGPSIHMEDVAPPRPRPGNAEPAYPEAARKSGLEGLVVLRLRIAADGSVADVELVSGDEPFVTAALAAVRSWSYEPARVDGVPTATHRLVRIPFRLRG